MRFTEKKTFESLAALALLKGYKIDCHVKIRAEAVTIRAMVMTDFIVFYDVKIKSGGFLGFAVILYLFIYFTTYFVKICDKRKTTKFF